MVGYWFYTQLCHHFIVFRLIFSGRISLFCKYIVIQIKHLLLLCLCTSSSFFCRTSAGAHYDDVAASVYFPSCIQVTFYILLHC